MRVRTSTTRNSVETARIAIARNATRFPPCCRRRAAGTPEPIPSARKGGTTVSLGEMFSSQQTDDGAPAGAMEVVVARMGANGKPELACVGSEQAARDFLEGRRTRPSKTPVDR